MSVITIRSAAGVALLAAVVAGAGYAVTTYADAAQAQPVKAAHATARADVTVRHPGAQSRHAAAATPKPAPSTAPAPKPAPAAPPPAAPPPALAPAMTPAQQWPTSSPPTAPTPWPTSTWSPMG